MRPVVPDGVMHVYHLYVIRHPRRDAIAAACRERQVDCAAYYTTPMHLQPVFADMGHKLGDFPNMDEAAATNLALPMHPNLTEEQVEGSRGGRGGRAGLTARPVLSAAPRRLPTVPYAGDASRRPAAGVMDRAPKL